MRFSKEFKHATQSLPEAVAGHRAASEQARAPCAPRPIRFLIESERLADLKMVARRLGVSPRFVQTLVRRKQIPVIRLGRRCTRFDLDEVLTAVRKFQVEEQGR